MSASGSQSNRCSACIGLRKPCYPECAYKEVFPHGSRMNEFVHISQTRNLKEVHDNLLLLEGENKHEYADSLFFDANCRSKYPIGGSLREFNDMKALKDSEFNEMVASKDSDFNEMVASKDREFNDLKQLRDMESRDLQRLTEKYDAMRLGTPKGPNSESESDED